MSTEIKLDPQLIVGMAEFATGPYDLARKIESYYEEKLARECGANAPAESFSAIFNDMQECGILDVPQRLSLSKMCGDEKREERLRHELTLIANQAAENVAAGAPAKITDEQFDTIETKGTEFFIRSQSPFGHLFR